MSGNHIAIIGAGIVGVSTAIWLQRKGYAVTLIDREGVAAGTSYGNAGILASSGIIPVTTPGLIFKAPGMLLSSDQPLFARWSYLPKMVPWLVQFLRKANLKDMKRITTELHKVMYDSVEQHLVIAKGTGAEKFIKSAPYVHAYGSKSEFDKDALYWDTLRQVGLDLVEMTADEIANYDPNLQGKFGYGIRSTVDGQITDPGEYIKALAEHFEDEGGKFMLGEIMDIESEGSRVTGVKTTTGKTIHADHFVLTAGAWSRPLAQKLGVKVPLETERGYHLEFVNANIELKSPVMVTSGKFAMNSMNGRLRCAGIVELGGLEAKPNRAPFELLKRKVFSLFPELEYDSINEWMGFRPSTPDSLPVIGNFPKGQNVWAGFGHQHLGLTGGPKTGYWLAQMIAGETPNEDLSAFKVERF